MACCNISSNSVNIFGSNNTQNYVVQLKRVRLATTANIVGVYASNIFTFAGFPLTIDGFNVNLGDRILLKDQINAFENGIYTVISNGPLNVVLSRTTDFQPACNTSKIIITEGATLTNSLWYLPRQSGFLFGVNDIIFIRDDGGSGGGGGGDITNATNVGGFAEVFKQKVGAILEFRTLEAGDNISIVQNANTLLINSAPSNNRIQFTINNFEIIVNNVVYENIGYIPWDHSEFSSYINGLLTFYAEINDQEIEIEVEDINNAVILATFITTGTGSYTVPTLIPASDTFIVVRVRNDATAGLNYSNLYGVILSFTL